MHHLTTPIELRRPALFHYGTATLAKLANWTAASGYIAPYAVVGPVNAAQLSVLGVAEISDQNRTPARRVGLAPSPTTAAPAEKGAASQEERCADGYISSPTT
ncbi:hypothetical protein CLG85_011680 [Yangia mangrovi]|uniref:Uncharacterized protein n=1 Tax=Alloyangia mangrovi TaxID=1779329 RepID=A0A2A3JVP7_9RHOB|nr:hypothetical protein [Alloyangia mangrovi]